MKKIVLIPILFLFLLQASAQTYNQTKNTEQKIKELSMDWMKAVENRDEKTLNKIVASEFTSGGTNFETAALPGDVWMKNTMENLKIDSTNYIKIHVDLKDNIAIVQSVFYWSFTFREFPTKKATMNLIDTWMKRKGA